MRTFGTAFPRAGLLGNPSDIYGGRVIAFSFDNFRAEVTIEPAEATEIAPDGGLLGALWTVFRERHLPAGVAPTFRMRFHSDIPRQVGLAGSSAILIAGLRALMERFAVRIEPIAQAELALEIEAELLGIVAGPMDRVIQVFEGVQFIDCRRPLRVEGVRALDATRLPPAFVAYDPHPGEASGVVHSPVRERWLRGDPEVRRTIATFPGLADRGVACLDAGDARGLLPLLNQNFDTRASIFDISERNREMVRVGREHGAATGFAGSGGAVVGLVDDATRLSAIEDAYRRAGFEFVRPRIRPPREHA
jgi:glucuronokinase